MIYYLFHGGLSEYCIYLIVKDWPHEASIDVEVIDLFYLNSVMFV